jgi:hypothetical protein
MRVRVVDTPAEAGASFHEVPLELECGEMR